MRIPGGTELGALSEGEDTLGSSLPTSGDPDVITSLTCSTLSVWLCNARNYIRMSLAD
jgi:hypothetical protein